MSPALTSPRSAFLSIKLQSYVTVSLSCGAMRLLELWGADLCNFWCGTVIHSRSCEIQSYFCSQLTVIIWNYVDMGGIGGWGSPQNLITSSYETIAAALIFNNECSVPNLSIVTSLLLGFKINFHCVFGYRTLAVSALKI